MSSCENYKELISQQLDEELNHTDKNQLNEHLASCSSCKEFYLSMNALHEELLSLPQFELKESMVDSLIANNLIEINENRKSPIRNSWRKYYGVAAAAIILVILVPLLPILNQNDQLVKDATQSESLKMAGNESDLNRSMFIMELAPTAGEAEQYDSADGGVNILAPNANEDNTFGISGSDKEKNPMFDRTGMIVEQENNQLVIYQDDVELYRTNSWQEGLVLRVESIDEIELVVVYTLLDSESKPVARYRINIEQNEEEKIN